VGRGWGWPSHLKKSPLNSRGVPWLQVLPARGMAGAGRGLEAGAVRTTAGAGAGRRAP